MLRPRRVCTRVALAATSLALVLSSSPPAGAAPTSADKASARAMLEEGTALLKRGEYAEALKQFVGADALVALPSTKVAVARAQIALGLFIEAEDSLFSALRLPVAPDEPAVLSQARAEAAQLLERTRSRVAEVTITLVGRGAASAIVSVDGTVVPREALVGPRRLNPGHHTLEARGEAGVTTASVDLAESEKKTVALEVEAHSTAAPGPSPPPDTGGPRPVHDPHASVFAAAWEDRAPWLIAGGAVGVLGAGVGAVAGILALGRQSDAMAHGCLDNRCPPPAHADVDAAKTDATLSTIAFAVAGAGIVTVALAVFWPRSNGRVGAF